ncbi:MAG: 50S ribosomal protein L7/L12 [Bacilli bacterium]
MAKISNKDIIESLKESTILEVKELVDMMKETFGVDPSAVAVAAAPAEAVVDEDVTKTVVLTSAGGQKLQVIKLVREITGLGLKEAKDVADNGGNVKENLKLNDANELKAKFEEVGATVELV